MSFETATWDPQALHLELREVVRSSGGEPMPPPSTLSVEGARAAVNDQFSTDGLAPSVRVQETKIPGDDGPIEGATTIPVRIYLPEADPQTLVLWFHGGGFVLGSPDIADGICRRVADAGPCVVVSVDYRLAPEHPFPAALADCYAATKWAVDQSGCFGVDSTNVAVAGGSAGGNLAAAVSLLARDLDTPEIAYQWLVYPMVDNDLSRQSFGEDPGGKAEARWYWENYLESPIHGSNPYAVPMRSPDLSDLPPGEVLTVEFDVFRDEGIAYAEALSDAGCEVEHVHYDDALHPFLNMDLELARSAIDKSVGRLTAAVTN